MSDFSYEYNQRDYVGLPSIYPYQSGYNIDIQSKHESLEKEIKYLKKKCSSLEYERNYYIHEGPYYDLFSKYVGLYDLDKNALFLHHFIDNKNVFPYGDCQYEGYYSCTSVRGSWDNWTKDYTLKKKCVRNSDGIYEGYVYYIVEESIMPGTEYEFKFKDADGDWIEPIDEYSSPRDLLINVKKNSDGIWNAIVVASLP